MKKILLLVTLFSLQTYADRIPATTPEPNEMMERHDIASETGGTSLNEGSGCAGCIAMKKSGPTKLLGSGGTIFRSGGSSDPTNSGSATGER